MISPMVHKKSVFSGLSTALLVLVVASAAYASSVSLAPIAVSADVQQVLQINVTLFKNSVSAANQVTGTSINFGVLVDSNGALISSANGNTGVGSIVALISAATSGRPYTITQTATQLSTGGASPAAIPAGAQTVVPVYIAIDNGGAPLVGAMGTAGSWVGTKTLYTSNAAGDVRVIQAHYAVTNDPAAGATESVPPNQPAGNYAANIAFTVTV